MLHVCVYRDVTFGTEFLKQNHHDMTMKNLKCQISNPRLDCSGGGGSKVLTPIRPVACLVGNLDVGETVVRLI